MLANDLSRVMELVEQAFPPDLSLQDEGKKLRRQVFFIDESFSDMLMLSKLLKLLDDNLGAKYKSASQQLYNNKLSWQTNKLEEMRSPGLMYVVYLEGENPRLFLSFLICEEYDILEKNDKHEVLYLYEIQICAELQNRGLGSMLLGNHLVPLAGMLNREIEPKIYCIELTVFSDNHQAIRLYMKLGGKLTHGSPKIVTVADYGRITRSKKKRQTTALGILPASIIPVYFTFYIPVGELGKAMSESGFVG